MVSEVLALACLLSVPLCGEKKVRAGVPEFSSVLALQSWWFQNQKEAPEGTGLAL